MFAADLIERRASIRQLRTVSVAVLLAVGLTACHAGPNDSTREVTGTATYRERIALPNEAELQVSLIDIENPETAGPVIAAFSRLDPGNPPYTFRLPYLDNAVDPGRSYGLSAQISAAGETLFLTPQPVPVITEGNPTNAEIVMIRGNSRAITPE